MAKTLGEVESLTKLKEKLDDENISRFSSIGQIRAFLRDCEAEKAECRVQVEIALEKERRELPVEIEGIRQEMLDEEAAIRDKVAQKVLVLQGSLDQLRDKQPAGMLSRYLKRRKLKGIERRISNLERSADRAVKKGIAILRAAESKKSSRYSYLCESFDAAVDEKYQPMVRDIERVKSVLVGLSTLIAGAVGEKAVAAQLEQLPSNFYVINDFSRAFKPPIYRKETSDRIVSIQVDHLVVGPPGVFLVETKNWSQQSIARLDLRSPVDQVLRSSFAMFVLLNSDQSSIKLKTGHHWGRKKVPVKNIIAMTNARPHAEFNHVKILSLDQLNGYIQYFEPVLDAHEVDALVQQLCPGV